jgi:hypothetical protein
MKNGDGIFQHQILSSEDVHSLRTDTLHVACGIVIKIHLKNGNQKQKKSP